MLKIIKNMLLDNSEDDYHYEYLLINTESNQMYKKNMPVSQAERFVKDLDAVPTAPIELIGTNYKEVSKDEFEFPLPF